MGRAWRATGDLAAAVLRVPFPVCVPLKRRGQAGVESRLVPHDGNECGWTRVAEAPHKGTTRAQSGVGYPAGSSESIREVMDNLGELVAEPPRSRQGRAPTLDLFAGVPIGPAARSRTTIIGRGCSRRSPLALEFGVLPWSDTAISGEDPGPDRRDVRSPGATVVPTDLIDKYGSDAVSSWEANGGTGGHHVRPRADQGRAEVAITEPQTGRRFVLYIEGKAGPSDVAR